MRTRLLVTALVLVLSLPAAAAAEDGPTIDTVAGGIPSGLAGTGVSVKPVGMDYDAEGNLFVADPGLGVIWKVTPDGTIHHVAGNGVLCLSDPDPCRGPDRTAGNYFFKAPAGLALASDGDIFVAEMRGAVVSRIDVQTGRVIRWAGTGERGYSPDHEGVPATEATLMFPQSLAIDSRDNLYIADIGNQRIRKVTPEGIITTVAGCGGQSFPGCFTWAQDGSPVESTPIGINGGTNGNGWAIAVSPSDELYIADVAQILRLDQEQDVYRVILGKAFDYATLPGQGEGGPASEARVQVIVAMTFAPNGDLYYLEGGGSFDNPWNRIQKIEAPATPASIVRHVGGTGIGNGYSGDGGPAKQARFAFAQPTGTWTGQGMAVSPGGTIAVGDVRNNRLRTIDPSTGHVDTLAGNGYGGADYVFRTFNLMPYDGFQNGLMSRGGFSGDGREATTAQLYMPVDVETDRFGNVYVLEYGSHRVRRIAPDGKITTIVGSGCVGEDCWSVRNNAPLGDGDLATKAQLFEPVAIALDRTGTQLYIADSAHQRVRQVNMGDSTFTAYPLSTDPIEIDPGEIQTVFGPGVGGCNLIKPYCGDGLPALTYAPGEVTGVATDATGNLYVSDEYVGVVVQVDPATSVVTTVAGVPHTSDCEGTSADGPGRTARLCGPGDITVAGGSLYVTETGYPGFADNLTSGFDAASRIRKVSLTDPLRTTTTVAGNGALGFDGDGSPGAQAMLALPHGVAVGPDGSVYIGDSGNSRIRRVAPNGIISTVAGAGTFSGYYNHDGCDFSGDGGAASEALLCAPMGLDFGPDGTLYVADAANNRIRAISGL